MSKFETDKWVRVMADNEADGLWAKNGGAVDRTELPVSVDLRVRLREWQDRFEREDRFDQPIMDPPFSTEGLLIAQEIKKQLPDWTVIYFDERDFWTLKMTKQKIDDRSSFEYEITLADEQEARSSSKQCTLEFE